jgi:hypothetical protein
LLRVGIAEVHHVHAELYIDNSGRCFGHSVVDDGFYFEGESFGEVIERLLRGRRELCGILGDEAISNQENDVDGISSYVELQVCLEMERDVRKEVDGKM